MALRCEDVRNPGPEADPEQVAEHLDGCEACDREFRARTAEAIESLPVGVAPSMAEVRRRIRNDRQSVVRFTAAAAAVLILIGTGWALFRNEQTTTAKPMVKELPPPVEVPIPDPPRLVEIPEVDRRYIQSEGVISHYLQFMLSCLNTPTEEDKREFLIRALLVLRESRSSLKARYDKGGAAMEVVTRDVLDEALQTMRSSPLASVKFLPSKINAFALVPPDQWRVDHVLGSKNWRLTLHSQALYLHFAYLKTALGADDALMGRIEDALWYDLYVNLPTKTENKDPQIPVKALEAVLPLLSARQQKIYRKIVGVP